MRLLVLGGTVFLGRHLVDAALAAGHEVTLFNRGKSGAGVFGREVEQVTGDRDGGLDALAGRRWDAAVDTSGYFPRVVRASAKLLADAVGHYTFVSSLSAYEDHVTPDQDESAPLARLEDPTVEEITGGSYGGLKALCEEAAEAALPGRTLNVRPGLIVGPHDPSDRFTYWPLRVARGGAVLAPAPPETIVELTDVRDLAGWLLRCAEAGTTGTYNASGPRAGKSTFGELLSVCQSVTESDASVEWVDEAFLLAQEVTPWAEVPLWVGSEQPGFATRSAARAIAAGLTFRPLEETVRDTLEWASARADHELKAGLAPERERELLAAWRAG